MALTLFTRRPAPTPAAPPAARPDTWPEIGETWKPEGVTVVERYYNQANAVVLFYTAAREYDYAIACLGCHFTATRETIRGYQGWYTLEDVATVANDHATTCRALPRDIPARPDDDAVRDRLKKWAAGCRRQDEDVQLRIQHLDLMRLTLQRSNGWIENALQQLADGHPDIVIAKPSKYSGGHTEFYARCS
ncbi:hypothetical protein [Streptomyces sp. NPDC056987]|uniref:hypothetical protein n=1 Tax=Streptomyces sp. NPDC056987 TaxID=3345988 RepID=UPI00362BE5F8